MVEREVLTRRTVGGGGNDQTGQGIDQSFKETDRPRTTMQYQDAFAFFIDEVGIDDDDAQRDGHTACLSNNNALLASSPSGNSSSGDDIIPTIAAGITRSFYHLL